jgi:hypothetical protein
LGVGQPEGCRADRSAFGVLLVGDDPLGPFT